MLAFPKNRGLRIDAILASEIAGGDDARQPGSIARCAKARSLPITRRFGRSLSCSHQGASHCQTVDLDIAATVTDRRCLKRELDVERWTLRRSTLMSAAPHIVVRNPPPKPLLIFDGDCHFCRRWIERWREITAGAVEYAPSQEVAERFPEIPREAIRTRGPFHRDRRDCLQRRGGGLSLVRP